MRKRKNRNQHDRSMVTEMVKLIAALISLLTAIIKLLSDD